MRKRANILRRRGPAGLGQVPSLEELVQHRAVTAAAAWWASLLRERGDAEMFTEWPELGVRTALAGGCVSDHDLDPQRTKVTVEQREIFRAALIGAIGAGARKALRERVSGGMSPLLHTRFSSDPLGGEPALGQALERAGLSWLTLPYKHSSDVREDVAIGWARGDAVILWRSPNWLCPDYMAKVPDLADNPMMRQTREP